MGGIWNPQFLSSLSGPGLAIIVCALFVWALVTERLVTGKQYRATLARAEKDADANRVLTQALIEKNAGDEVSANLLAALRQEAAVAAASRDVR